MSDLEQRLERLAEKLTAKERALLVLRAFKEERRQDPVWRRTMPEEQVEEFGGYLRRICGLNGELGWYLLVLNQEVEKLDLHLESLTNLMLWGLSGWRTRLFMMRHTKEPVTESEYRELEAKARMDPMPVDELAELLEDESRNREAVDVEELERLRQDKAGELAALVDQGILVGGEEDGRRYVQAGSYYDWVREPVPMHPAWAREYEVLPDDEAEQVKDLREGRLTMRLGVGDGPMQQTAQLLGIEERLAELAEPTPRDDLLELHTSLFRAGMAECWRRLGAVELVVEEVRQELDGEDPLAPVLRELVEESRQTLELCRRAERFSGPLELEEPREEDLAWVYGLMGAG